MHDVQEVLKRKGTIVHTASPDETVYQAIERMEKLGVGALVVVGDDRIVGMITERDYLRKVALLGRSSRTTPVREIMSSPVAVCHPGDSIDRCLATMTEGRFRHLPVVDGDQRLLGLVSIGDLVKHTVRTQRVEIRHLEAYIRGEYPG